MLTAAGITATITVETGVGATAVAATLALTPIPNAAGV
jgi:hypothetical protein